MRALTATLETVGQGAMNVRAPKPETADEKRGNNMKFTYASGSTPLGGYTIKRGVGRGGFGEVFLGWDEELERAVAIKVAHEGALLLGEDREATLSEARVAATVRYPSPGSNAIVSATSSWGSWVTRACRGRPDWAHREKAA